MELQNRKRSVDVEKLEVSQLEAIGYELGKKVGSIGDEAAAKINEITAIYGIKAKVSVQLLDINTGEILKE